MNNYNVIVASDHKGNKSLTIVKGKLTPEMTKKNNIGSINDLTELKKLSKGMN